MEVWNEQKLALGFSRETITLLAELNAEVGFDYGFEDDEDHTH